MKKILLMLLVLVCTFAFVACGEETSESVDGGSSIETSDEASQEESHSEPATGSEESAEESAIESEEESEEESLEESSEDASVAITYTVTFKQAGEEDIVITVEEGKGIAAADMPTPAEVVGHTVSWEVTEVSGVTANITVNAVANPNTYTITYIVNVAGIEAPEAQDVVYGTEVTLADIADGRYEFSHWVIEGTDTVFESGEYEVAGDITLVAVFNDQTNPY